MLRERYDLGAYDGVDDDPAQLCLYPFRWDWRRPRERYSFRVAALLIAGAAEGAFADEAKAP